MRANAVVTSLAFCLLVESMFADVKYFKQGKEVYVDSYGHDYPGCGPQDTPCQTIRYAINLTEPFSKVLINGSNGPYTNESGDTYMIIRHSLWLSSWSSKKVVIECTKNSFMLFNVVGENLDKPRAATCLTLSNIIIRECHNSGFSANGVISLANAQLKLNNSEFIQNGQLIHHPQTSANESCNTIDVYIKDCSFKSNFVARPFLYGISLFGCQNITLQVEDSNFQSTPIAVKSANGTKARFIRVGFDGTGIKGSSVQITVSNGDNGISFNKCNFTRHLASKSSPMTVFVEEIPQGDSTLSFTETNFFKNQRQSTSGGALSVISRFRKLAELDIRLDRCMFEENSATDIGGAIHIAYVKLVHISGCQFKNNTGTNGGAIYLSDTQNVTVANSIFENNSATTETHGKTMAKGGAIYVEKSDLQVTYSNFTGNTAFYSGSALFATECSALSLISSRFENIKATGKVSPQNHMLSILTVDSNTENATVWLAKNLLLVHGMYDQNVIFVKGKIYERNTSITCPEGHNSDHSVLLPNYTPKYFNYVQLGAWCEACPYGKYGVTVSKDLTPNDTDAEKKNDFCKSCPLNAICQYGQIRALPNYWGQAFNDGSVEMFLCPREHCCDSLTSCTGYNICKENRNGTLCGECAAGTEKSIHLGYAQCTRSEHCWGSGAMAGFVIGFFLLFFLILALKYNLLKLYPPSNDDEEETFLPETEGILVDHQDEQDALATQGSETASIQGAPNNSNHLAGCCFSVVVFYQLASIVYPKFSASGETVDTVVWLIVETFNFLPPMSIANICTGRLFPHSLSTPRFLFVRIYFWALLICPWIIFGVALACVRFFSGSDWQQKANRIRAQFDAYLIFLVLYSYVPLMRFSYEAISCISIHNNTFVIGDSTTACYQTGQILIILYLLFFVIPLFLVVEKAAHLLYKSSISWNTFILCCVFPLIGLIKMTGELVFCKRPSSEDDIHLTSNRGQLEAHDKRSVFYAVTIKPYRKSHLFCVSINGLTVMLFRSFLLVAVGTILSPWPFIQSIILAACCIFFLVHHLCTKWFVNNCVNRLEYLHLILLVSFAVMNVYSSVLYVLGQSERAVTTGVVENICDWFCRIVLMMYLLFWIFFILYRAVKIGLIRK